MSDTSSAMPWPAAASRAGRPSRRSCDAGCARSRTERSTARQAMRRSSGSSARTKPSSLSAIVHRSASSATFFRRVQADCAIDLDTNSYSVPWRLI